MYNSYKFSVIHGGSEQYGTPRSQVEKKKRWMWWWHMPLITALGKQRWVYFCALEPATSVYQVPK